MSGESWTACVAGLTCFARAEVDGDWIVTVASASVARHESLAEAIFEATGGLATRTEAEALASSIHARQRIRELVTSRSGRKRRRGRAGRA
jgi:hypothetical protein